MVPIPYKNVLFRHSFWLSVLLSVLPITLGSHSQNASSFVQISHLMFCSGNNSVWWSAILCPKKFEDFLDAHRTSRLEHAGFEKFERLEKSSSFLRCIFLLCWFRSVSKNRQSEKNPVFSYLKGWKLSRKQKRMNFLQESGSASFSTATVAFLTCDFVCSDANAISVHVTSVLRLNVNELIDMCCSFLVPRRSGWLWPRGRRIRAGGY